ncbi:MAG: hypothetical protein IT379_12985 [Deltaproteobacteria bacterium]|nr:hypothetical protein [Deltaproteobacteria bacterium]
MERFAALACVLLGGCCCPMGGSGNTTTTTSTTPAAPATPTGITITSVTFGRSIDAEGRIDQPMTEFAPTDTEIRASIWIDGRPSRGIVEQRLLSEWSLEPIASATVDLSQVNVGLTSAAGRTLVTGRFTLDGGAPFYIGSYRLEVRYDGAVAGTYPFRVAPLAGAIPSRVTRATLARGVSPERAAIEPATTFAASDTPTLVGTGDFGQHSWLEVRWMTNGVVHRDSVREARFDRNRPAATFSFDFRPAGGWPTGQHEVVLLLDGPVVGRYPFTVSR